MNQKKSRSLLGAIQKALIEFLKTQFMIMAVVTVITWTTLSLLGVRYTFLLSFITGSLSVIPMVGLLTSAVIISLVATFDRTRFISNAPEFVEGITVLFLFLVFNGVIDLFLSPFLARKFTQLHPFIVFCGVLTGSALFGFFGALFAVPVLLVGKTIWEYVETNYS